MSKAYSRKFKMLLMLVLLNQAVLYSALFSAVYSALYSRRAQAQSFDEDIKISGYLTIGGGKTDAEPLEVSDDPDDIEDQQNTYLNPPRYVAYADKFILDPDFNFNIYSKAGLQIDYAIDQQTQATIQITGRGDVDNFDPDMSWLYISHQLTSNTTIRAGRFRIPLYYASAFIDVGLAYPWVTPPAEIYTLINMDNMTGVDLITTHYLGDWVLSVQPYYGSSDFERIQATTIFRNILGITSQLQNDFLTTRFSWLRYHLDFEAKGDIQKVADEQRKFLDSIGYADLIDYVDPRDTDVQFLSFGIEYRHDNTKVISEFARSTLERAWSDVDAWYITIGHTLGHYFPHITLARHDERNEDKRLPPRTDEFAAEFPALAGASEQRSWMFHGILDNETTTITLGLNYQLTATVLLKTEWMRTHNDTSTGFYNFATKDKSNNIYNLALEAIF